MSRKTIKIGHASSLVPPRLSKEGFEDDLREALLDGCDVLSMTEVGARREEIRDIAPGLGYRPVFFRHREMVLLYHHDAGVRLLDKGEQQSHRAGRDFPARSIVFGQFAWEGERVWMHAAHWLAHLADSRARVAAHNRMTSHMVDLVRLHGRGRDLSFFGGDTNEDDKPREDRALGNMHTQFRRGGLVTCWDEERRYPSTFRGRTLDVVGGYRADNSVELLRSKVRKQRADHDRVWGEFEVAR